jgi:transposase InsO family protein
MPWETKDIMSLREEFVYLATKESTNRRDLCQRFGISPQTAYKWLARFSAEGCAGLVDRSRRPHHTPSVTPAAIQSNIITLRQRHPAWGGRKISRRLRDMGEETVAPSTVNSILHRHGMIVEEPQHLAWQRFEHETPNALWQADFKGYFDTLTKRCMPLTVLDDHSRFNLVLQACADMRTETVQAHLQTAFRRYGLPARMNFDNGAPWGSPAQPGQVTTLALWLVRLGIRISYSRPYHPQTNGKEERFHRSLKAEVLNGRSFNDLSHAQAAFDRWRRVYNHARPHEGIGLHTPISRYSPSPRAFPEALPEIEYGLDETVVRVTWNGDLRYQGKKFKVSNALQGHDVVLRPRFNEDGVFDIFYAHHRCGSIDLADQ